MRWVLAVFWVLVAAVAWPGCGGSQVDFRDRERPFCADGPRLDCPHGSIIPSHQPPECGECVVGCPREGMLQVARGCGDQAPLHCEQDNGARRLRCDCRPDGEWQCDAVLLGAPTVRYVEGVAEDGAPWPAELSHVEVDWETQLAAVYGEGTEVEVRDVHRDHGGLRMIDGVLQHFAEWCPRGRLVLRYQRFDVDHSGPVRVFLPEGCQTDTSRP